MKTFIATRALAGLVCLIAVFFCGCDCRTCWLLIPKGENGKPSAIIRGPDYVIVPRPVTIDIPAASGPSPSSGEAGIQQNKAPTPFHDLNALLGDDPKLYRVVPYNDGTKGKSTGENNCLPNNAWDLIDENARKDGASTIVIVYGGKTCFNQNSIDSDIAKQCGKLEEFLKKYAR